MRVCSSTPLASYTSFGFGCLLFDAMLPLLTLCCRFSLDLFAKRACRRNCFLQHALFHRRVKPWNTSARVTSRWYGLPAAKDCYLLPVNGLFRCFPSLAVHRLCLLPAGAVCIPLFSLHFCPLCLRSTLCTRTPCCGIYTSIPGTSPLHHCRVCFRSYK